MTSAWPDVTAKSPAQARNKLVFPAHFGTDHHCHFS